MAGVLQSSVKGFAPPFLYGVKQEAERAGFTQPFLSRVKQEAERAGFTLIEIIITIVIVAVFLTCIALMFQQNINGLVFSADLTRALNLARLEISKINNLSYNDSTLADGYNHTTANYENSSYDLNRTVNYVAGTSNNLKKVEVTLYPAGTTNQLIKLATYIADVSFGPGSGGGGVGSGGGEADSLAVVGGVISGERLRNITFGNSDTEEEITIVGVRVTFSGASGIELKEIKIGGSERWSGTESSGNYVALDTNFQLDAGTTYSNTCLFRFSKNLNSAEVTFTMSDGTTTESYIWP